MNLIGNKLTPADGMHLIRLSDGSVAEGVMYIPSSLSVEDFTEVTHEEYLQIIQAGDTTPDPILEQLNELKKQTQANSAEITNVQEALCEIYESII